MDRCILSDIIVFDPDGLKGQSAFYEINLWLFIYYGKAGCPVLHDVNHCDFTGRIPGSVFRLYDQGSGGVQVGPAITTTVPISEGLFAVNLDFGGGIFTGDGRWLDIRVMCPGDAGFADLGRQELTAAPYALHALGAPWSGLTGVPAGFADGIDNDTAYSAGNQLDLVGTTFQRSVWEALQTIPYGETRSYGEIAAQIGSPSASRAVGLANGHNPVGIIVPCHRVIGANGNLTGYGGGLDRKRALLALEKSRNPVTPTLFD